MPLDAILVEDRPITDADIRRRIAAGRPSISTTPERLSLEPTPSPPILTLPPPGVPTPLGLMPEDPGSIYLQVALYLSQWDQANPGACDPSDFGELPEDFAGQGGERTTRAIGSFQRWANARGARLRADGALDPATFVLLSRVASDASAAQLGDKPAPAKDSSFPWWGLAAGAAVLALLFRRELGF